MWSEGVRRGRKGRFGGSSGGWRSVKGEGKADTVNKSGQKGGRDGRKEREERREQRGLVLALTGTLGRREVLCEVIHVFEST